MGSVGLNDPSIIYKKSRSKWYHGIADFANVMKAFIGTNYLSVPYAFSQSGIIAGLILLLIIASLTSHCCQLIVKCKYYALDILLWKFDARHLKSSDNMDQQRLELESQLQKQLSYGDIGMIAFGRIGQGVVNFCVFLTQFGYCIGYSIFVGNTLLSFFPVVPQCVLLHVANNTQLNTSLSLKHIMGIPSNQFNRLPNHSISWNCTNVFNKSGTLIPPSVTETPKGTKKTVISHLSNHNATFPVTTSISPLISTDIITSSSHILLPHVSYVKMAPNLYILILLQLPILILFSFVRNMRVLGIISICANASIVLGWGAIMIFLFIKFSFSDELKLISSEASIFFGLLASAFEGIGTIIPIESSMDGNRHNFSKFLNGAILIVSFILLVLGLFGYLRFGSHVNQLINLSLIHSGLGAHLLNACLIVAVICTYPLMIYPVLQMIENFVFVQETLPDSETMSTNLLDSFEEDYPLPVTKPIPSSHGKRTLNDDDDDEGEREMCSIGGTLLLFILPCIFELSLWWKKLSVKVIIKNVFIALFGLVGSCLSLYSILRKMSRS
uniref:Amino acid transporter transmembrane domain-containing protein n=1 Tax=Octopus bimaculoides TaxID=37653 RepID=A0A0L8GXY0_OCTBM